jgi:uncharacterized protein (DUF1778 family)
MVAAVRRERLEARVTPEQKALFQRAADLTGRSLTDFIVSSAQIAAEEAIERHHVINLSVRDSLIFAEAILNSAEPNENLRAAAQRYRELFGDRL